MSENLLPCPFCGGKPEWDEWYPHGCLMFVIKCSECNAQSCFGVNNEKKVIYDLWNKRILPNK